MQGFKQLFFSLPLGDAGGNHKKHNAFILR